MPVFEQQDPKQVLFSEFLMACGPYFTAVSLKITSIKQKDLVGNDTLLWIYKEPEDEFCFLELIYSMRIYIEFLAQKAADRVWKFFLSSRYVDIILFICSSILGYPSSMEWTSTWRRSSSSTQGLWRNEVYFTFWCHCLRYSKMSAFKRSRVVLLHENGAELKINLPLISMESQRFLSFKSLHWAQHVNRDRSECKILLYLQLADLLVKFLMFETQACKMETSAFSCGIKMQVFLCVL